MSIDVSVLEDLEGKDESRGEREKREVLFKRAF